MINLLYKDIIPSMATGIFFLFILFAISALIVIGIKLIFITLLEDQKEVEPPPVKKKRKVYRSINIDPSQVDRIIVKRD